MSEKENKTTKSLDELLAKKKTSQKADENDNMRSKMNRLKQANSVFDDTKAMQDVDSKKLEEEKKKIEHELKSLKAQVKSLYNLKYQEVKVIDKKTNDLTDEIKTSLKNAKDKEEIENKLKDLNNELKKAKKDLKKANDDRQKLDEYSKGLVSALNKIKEEKDQSDKNIESISQELDKIKQEQNANQTTIASLNNQVEALEQGKTDNSLKDKEIDALNQKIEKLNALKEKESLKNASLNDKNKQLAEELKQAKNDNKALTKSYNSLEKENSKANLKIEALNKENEECKAKIEELSKAYEENKQALDEANQNNELLLDVTSGLSQEFRNYEVKDVNDSKELEAIKSENEELNEKLRNYVPQNNDIDENIKALNEKIDALEKELNEKNQEIEALNKKLEDTSSKEIDDLLQQIDSKEFAISQLNDEKKELMNENEVIPSLKDQIQELELKLSQTEKEYEDFKHSHENEDAQIEASIYDELKEIQAECDKAVADLEEMKQEKNELEQELQIAYTALKDQEEILNEQQEILNTQQEVINHKMDDYYQKEKDFKEQVKLFEKEKNEYDKDRRDYEEYKLVSSAKQDDILRNENDFDELRQELEDKKAEIAALNNDLNLLIEEKNKNEETLKQYLDDIHSNEARIDDLVDTLATKEVDLDNNKNKLQSVLDEYEEYKKDKIAKENELEGEIEKLKSQLASINSDNEKLSISKFNESRLQSRIFELENNIKILSMKQDNNQDASLQASLDQYRNLLANERSAHEESEDKITNELNNLRSQFDVLNDKLEKYSSNYLYVELSNQISLINEINEDIVNSNIDVNRDVYSKYYSEALKINSSQNEVYSLEIARRNELLTKIKNEKEQELQELNLESDANVTNSLTYNKIRMLYMQIREIDLLINSQIRTVSPLSSEQVEEEILKIYKKKLITYHKQMENNIKNLEKNIDDNYSKIKSIDELIDTYKDDCEEMAKEYANEIAKLNAENQFDNNPFSKLLREEKIILLANDFENLVNLRDKKFEEVQNQIASGNKNEYIDTYNSSIQSFEAIKDNIKAKMEEIEKEANDAKMLNLEEQKHIKEDIEHLTSQLEQLNNFGDDKIVSEDRKKVKVLLAGKQERLDYLNNIKAVESEKHYQELLDQIKAEYDEVLNEEASTKDVYEKRRDAFLKTRKIKTSASSDIGRLDTIGSINKYLLDLNEIDEIFNKIANERTNFKDSLEESKKAQELKQGDAKTFLDKYRNLWKLYDKYQSAKKTMEEDVEDIRTYMVLKNEASGVYRKYISYQKTNANLQERIKMGLDVEKNKELLNVNTSKVNTFKNRVDYLNNQANALLKNLNVSAYAELTSKIDEIIHLIKQMDLEFQKYLN